MRKIQSPSVKITLLLVSILIICLTGIVGLANLSCITINTPPRTTSTPEPETIVPNSEPIPVVPVVPVPTPETTLIPTVTEYYELPGLHYHGLSPPLGKPYNLYSLLLQITFRSNWASLYKAGEFDCSEMSGFLENYLELNGFDTYILTAEVTERDWAGALDMELQKVIGLRKGGKAYHAWVAVKIDGEYMAVEATLPCITNYYGAYKYQYIYTSVKDAEKANPGQFDYWNSNQIDSLHFR